MVDADGLGRLQPRQPGWAEAEHGAAGIALASPWSDATPILCRDGKWRLVPAELEVQRVADRTAEGLASRSPLAPSEPGRVARLRALGNAVCPRQAYVPARALYEELSR